AWTSSFSLLGLSLWGGGRGRGTAACRGCAGRARSSRSACQARSPLQRHLDCVTFKCTRGRELAEFVPDHLFGDIHRDELLAVMYGYGVAYHLGNNRRPARPRLHHLLFVPRVERLYAIAQRSVYERSFF